MALLILWLDIYLRDFFSKRLKDLCCNIKEKLKVWVKESNSVGYLSAIGCLIDIFEPGMEEGELAETFVFSGPVSAMTQATWESTGHPA